jgi:hypothetical protein
MAKGIRYLSEEGGLKDWPDEGAPSDVNTDPEAAVGLGAAIVESTDAGRVANSGEANKKGEPNG